MFDSVTIIFECINLGFNTKTPYLVCSNRHTQVVITFWRIDRTKMKSEKGNIQNLIRYTVSLGLVLSMLLPIVGQALDVLSESTPEHQVMTMDQPEESQQEEQQEDKTKDEKIEMKLLSTYYNPFLYISGHNNTHRLDAGTDFILEIPIPPPEQR